MIPKHVVTLAIEDFDSMAERATYPIHGSSAVRAILHRAIALSLRAEIQSRDLPQLANEDAWLEFAEETWMRPGVSQEEALLVTLRTYAAQVRAEVEREVRYAERNKPCQETSIGAQAVRKVFGDVLGAVRPPETVLSDADRQALDLGKRAMAAVPESCGEWVGFTVWNADCPEACPKEYWDAGNRSGQAWRDMFINRGLAVVRETVARLKTHPMFHMNDEEIRFTLGADAMSDSGPELGRKIAQMMANGMGVPYEVRSSHGVERVEPQPADDTRAGEEAMLDAVIEMSVGSADGPDDAAYLGDVRAMQKALAVLIRREREAENAIDMVVGEVCALKMKASAKVQP